MELREHSEARPVSHGSQCDDPTAHAFCCPDCGGVEFQHQEFVLVRRYLSKNEPGKLIFNGYAEAEWDVSKDEILWCEGCQTEIELTATVLEVLDYD